MVESSNRVLLNQQQIEEQWERDDVAITAKLLWFFARYNLLHLCGVIGPAPYLKPRGLVRLAWIFCDTDRGRYTGQGQRFWMPHGEAGVEEVKRADTQMEG